jgi:hypothetical protein
MKRLNFLFYLLFALMLSGCQPGITYQYQNLPQQVTCQDLDQELMHEAIYSFQEDIGRYYNQYTDHQKGSKSYYIEAYAQFVFYGFSGTAAYYDIASTHSQEILAALIQEKDLWVITDDQYKINYDHPYLVCLLENIKADELRVPLQNLSATGSLSPELIAETMRVNFRQIISDPYLAMYMALDAYYQPLRNKTSR